MSYTENEEIEEQIHFSNIVATFERYEQHSISANVRRRKDFLRLPSEDQNLLEKVGWKKKLDDVDAAIQANARFLQHIIMHPEIFEVRADLKDKVNDDEPTADGTRHSRYNISNAFDETNGCGETPSISHSHSHSHDNTGSHHAHDHFGPSRSNRARYRPSEPDMDKLRSTVRQLVRDWSQEGKPERDACYLPMTNALLEHFSGVPPEARCNFRVLVPGSGLARLALDVAKLG